MVGDAYKYIMIRRVVLHNWKSHYRTTVEFEEGTNVIVGINGAGKSSVLEGIYFALFGPPEKKGFYERVLREGEKEGYVEVTFSHGGKTYTVKRWFDRRGQRDARLEGDERVITSRPRDVDEKIVRILGMDGKMFRDAVYARQNEMASILLDSKRRKEMIDEMIEISEFSRVRDAVVALRNRLRDWIRGAESVDYDGRLRDLSSQRERKEKALK
ncbi:TPA: SMC family ATPase, partial [Candidatus Micrarchaeota archaeon]|nr:SMC family ATPase [Candidatus Micrarchaeota archaeon]